MTAIRRRSPGCQAGLASIQLEHAELIAEREYLGAKLAIDHARSPDDPRATQPAQPESVTPGRCLSAPIELTPKALPRSRRPPRPEHAFWYLVCWVQLCCHRAVSATVGIATRSRCRYGNRIGGQSDDLRLEISEPRQDGLDSFAGPRVNGPEATNHSRSRRGSAAHP